MRGEGMETAMTDGARVISLDELEEAVRDLAKQYPDAVYEIPESETVAGCMYTHGEVANGPDTPGCILGQALSRFLPFDLLRQYDAEGMGFSDYLDELDVRSIQASSRIGVLDWMRDVQRYQDQGYGWATAVRLADTDELEI